MQAVSWYTIRNEPHRQKGQHNTHSLRQISLRMSALRKNAPEIVKRCSIVQTSVSNANAI